jgi:hypothetical protein
MSGKWLATIGVFAMSLPATMVCAPPVRAQYLDSYLSSQRDNNRIRHQQKIRQERLAQQAGNRKGASWQRHVEACKRAYRSYDPKTDRYTVRRGVTRKCLL